MMRKKRALYRMNYKKFVEAFIKYDGDAVLVAQAVGVSPTIVPSTATRLRKSGVQLPRKNNPRPTKDFVTELNEIISNVNKEIR